MGFENLGPNVSQNPQKVQEPANGTGQYTSQDHSWEQLVIQQDKPSADWEINLLQAILGPSGVRTLNQRILPSVWLNPGFLERSDVTASYVFLSPDTTNSTTANLFQLLASNVNVNGWLVRFDLSQDAVLQAAVALGLPQVTQGTNYVVMPSPPAGGQRTDLVILEVWRALVSPAPSMMNKSPAGQILRYGNAKCPDVNPDQNLNDDLIDPTYLQETSRRVQIQYRYRVIPSVDIISYPDGLDSLTVFANTIPIYPSPPGVDGSPTAYNYTKSVVDPGLWVAGSNDNSGSAALGTVDGLMYAIPICAIARRNSTAFDRSNNLNGAGLMGSGISGRPDGLYADQISVGDVQDLRKGFAYDFEEVLDKIFQQILDNTLSTEIEINQVYGVSNTLAGTSFTFKDDIGTSSHIGNPDGVRIDFSDRSVTESIAATSGLIVGPTSTVTFNLNSVTPAYTGAPSLDVSVLAPVGTNIVGIGSLRIITSSADIDLLNILSIPYAQSIVLTASTVTVNLSAPTSNFTVIADLQIEYPSGSGAQRNVTQSVALWTPPAASIAAWVDPTQLTATSDATRFALTDPGSPTVNTNLWWMDIGHREVSARLRTVSQGPNTYYTDSTGNYIWIPEKLTGPVTVTAPAQPPTSNYTQNTTYTQVTLTVPLAPNTPVTVNYTAMRPIQPVSGPPDDSYQIWYTTQAIQSIPVPSGTQTLPLYTRAISQQLHVITNGSGSPDSGFPYAAPSAQIPATSLPPSPGLPESLLDTPNVVSIVGFGINSGYASLPVFIPYSPNPGQVQLYSVSPNPTIDGDGRNFWPRSDPGSPPIYSPTVFSQNLSTAQLHKNAFPVLMELAEDFASIGRQGTIVLVVFGRWGSFDTSNTIDLQPNQGDTAASVYRVRGNMLNPRRVVT